MQDLKVTLVQTSQAWEDKMANIKNYEEQLARIKEPTDLILLPEMFHTSFSMNAMELAEKMDGKGVQWLKKQAAKFKSAFATSLIIEEEGKYFNRMVFVKPNGTLSTYDKRKLFGMAKEDQHFSPGLKNTIVTYKGWKILLQVCYDLRFPELCRNKMNDSRETQYDLLLYVANWPEKRSMHWKALLPARAIENQCFVAAVNRVGVDGNNHAYSGDSMVINPLGTITATKSHSDVVITQTLKASELSETHKKMPFLKDA